MGNVLALCNNAVRLWSWWAWRASRRKVSKAQGEENDGGLQEAWACNFQDLAFPSTKTFFSLDPCLFKRRAQEFPEGLLQVRRQLQVSARRARWLTHWGKKSLQQRVHVWFVFCHFWVDVLQWEYQNEWLCFAVVNCRWISYRLWCWSFALCDAVQVVEFYLFHNSVMDVYRQALA